MVPSFILGVLFQVVFALWPFCLVPGASSEGPGTSPG